MSQQIQQLESTIQALKIRAFDAQEIATQHQQTAEAFRGILGQVAQLLGLEGDQIQASDVIAAVELLVQGEDEVEKEAE